MARASLQTHLDHLAAISKLFRVFRAQSEDLSLPEEDRKFAREELPRLVAEIEESLNFLDRATHGAVACPRFQN